MDMERGGDLMMRSGGLARAFWASKRQEPDEHAIVDMLLEVLTGFARLDPDAYAGSWYEPLGGAREDPVEVSLTPEALGQHLSESSGQDWRAGQSGRSAHLWREASDGTTIFINCALGVTSPHLKNTIVVGLSASTTADLARCRRLVEHLYEICQPDTADAVSPTLSQLFAIGS